MHKINTLPIIKFSVKYPKIVIILSLLITLIFVLPLSHIQIEPDVESLLPESLTSNTVKYDKLLIMVSGDNLFTLEGLQQVQTTNKELQQILPVKQIIDPFSFKTLEKTGSRLMAVPLSPGNVAPETKGDLKVFEERLKKTRFASGIVSSMDKQSLVSILLIDKTEDYKKTMESIDKILIPLRNKLNVIITGTIPFSAETEMFLTDGFSKLLIFVLITILISYYLGFRSKRAVFLPMLIVISGTVVSLGMMVLLGYKLTMISILSPPLVLTLGSSYSIHVMSAYFSLSRTSKESKKDTIIKSISGVSGTVLLASFTTLIGLMSLLMATIRQTREFAITTSLGIIFTALLSITLLPAFLSIQQRPETKKLKELNRDILSKFLKNFGPRIINWKFQAYGILLIIVVVFIILLPKISFNTSPTKYFPKSSMVISDHSQ
ncbi:MAG: MMPL family transporter, partial [Spirochaetaceae bacterium]|nr:MMPL family transporter [Spirochaetaceae bacterium]